MGLRAWIGFLVLALVIGGSYLRARTPVGLVGSAALDILLSTTCSCWAPECCWQDCWRRCFFSRRVALTLLKNASSFTLHSFLWEGS